MIFSCGFLWVIFLVISQANTNVFQNFPPKDSIALDASSQYEALVKKTLPNSPSGGYAPAVVDCPLNRPTIRKADDLSPNEISWLERRRNQTIGPMTDWLSRAGIAGFDAVSYINSVKNSPLDLPNIGIAISGGGYRALMNGGGFLAAADNRTTNATSVGHIGGLLQATTYLAGLSGGGWLVGSVYVNNFTTVEALRDGKANSNTWKFSRSIFEGPDGKSNQVVDTFKYISSIRQDVESKEQAGFNVSVTDFWGRALSFQLFDADRGGPAHTFSSIALQQEFTDGLVPFPMMVALSRAPNANLSSVNSTLFEMNPFELGSWDSMMNGFAPTEYLGSNFSAGTISPQGNCVKGFDQVGFIVGTTSTLLNAIILRVDDKVPPFLLQAVLKLTDKNNDVAQFQPNPFYGFNPEANQNARSTELSLVDGGEDEQNIPLWPLLQPQRHVDVIFSVDSTANTKDNWPNGKSLVATYQRSLNRTISNTVSFPPVPDINTMVNLGLNKRPTFFGCNVTNTTGQSPLIVYIPNTNYVTLSNVSTFQLTHEDSKRNEIIQNGYEIATLGNGTLDSQWPACLGCAVLSRSFSRTGTPVPDACKSCFDFYCWNGTIDSHSGKKISQRSSVERNFITDKFITTLIVILHSLFIMMLN